MKVITKENGYEITFIYYPDFPMVRSNTIGIPKHLYQTINFFGQKIFMNIGILDRNLYFPNINGGPKQAFEIIENAVKNSPHFLIAEPFDYGMGQSPIESPLRCSRKRSKNPKSYHLF